MLKLPTIAALLAWTANRNSDRSATPQRITKLMQAACPQPRPSKTIKVAGTNGKGSVCAMLEAHLLDAGHTVGVFTSPHLQRITERIKVNGAEIAPRLLEHHAREIQPTLHGIADTWGSLFIPSFFEVLLLIALRIFSDERVEHTILEAGIGGAHDATGPIPAAVSAVTSIAFDHEAKIGPTLNDIAREKAGIATPNATLILGPAIPTELVRHIHASTASKTMRITQANRRRINTRDPNWPPYQFDNLATALAMLDAANHRFSGDPRPSDPPPEIPQSTLDRSPDRPARSITIPGRFEYIEGSPAWLLDGAHNAEGIDALITAVNHHFASRERILIFGASEGRSYARYLARIHEIAAQRYVVDGFPNAADSRDLIAAMPHRDDATHPPNSTLTQLLPFVRKQHPQALIIVAGSIFLVGAARAILQPASEIENRKSKVESESGGPSL